MQAFHIEELSFVVLAKNHNPTVLNPDFLKQNDIVPKDWELAATPVCVEPLATVSFSSGVNIVAQPDRVTFSERIAGKTDDVIAVPRIAAKYVETLRHVQYRGLGINPGGHIPADKGPNEAREFIVSKFLSPVVAKYAGTNQYDCGVRIVFPAGDWKCNVGVDEGTVQRPGKAAENVVIFAGNYHRDLVGESLDERLKHLQASILEWQNLIEHFRDFVVRVTTD